jgi:hypothetical protein
MLAHSIKQFANAWATGFSSYYHIATRLDLLNSNLPKWTVKSLSSEIRRPVLEAPSI